MLDRVGRSVCRIVTVLDRKGQSVTVFKRGEQMIEAPLPHTTEDSGQASYKLHMYSNAIDQMPVYSPSSIPPPPINTSVLYTRVFYIESIV
jgi:hypothetical protein